MRYRLHARLSAARATRAARAAVAVLAAVALISACGGGGDAEDGGDASPTGATAATAPATETATLEATPEARWPTLGTARIVTDDLDVRAGPGQAYLVLGRLQPDDEVPVAGRANNGRWLALPGIGWVAYDETWEELSVPWDGLPRSRLARPTSSS